MGRIVIKTGILLALFSSGFSQTFTAADSGWVKLFNEQNLDGLYSRMYNQPVMDTPDAIFTVDTQNKLIHVDPGGGHIGTDGEYSHYLMRVDYRFGASTASGANAGLMYHITEDWPRMSNNWPRSIECQMKKNQTGYSFSIQDVTYEVPVEAGNTGQYEEGSTTMTTSFSGNHRFVRSLATFDNPYVNNQWNTMLVIVRGSDSAEHIVNDKHLLKLYNIRIPNPNGGGEVPWPKGKIAVQAEGAEISYRRWEVMELPDNSPTNYLNRLFVRSPKGAEVWQVGSTQEITWEHIGVFANVKIEYSIGNNQWIEIVASTPNDGSYDWTVPTPVSQTVKVRVSAQDWVQSGASENNFEISPPASISGEFLIPFKFVIKGTGQNFSCTCKEREILEIYDVGGELIFNSKLKSVNFVWNGLDNNQLKVKGGIYFLRVKGKSKSETFRFLIP